MKKILVFTDSLGLPRRKPEVVLYEESWPIKLHSSYKVHQVCLGGATIKDFYDQLHYSSMFEPDCVIVQAGIVDCAPRALSKFENEFLNKFCITRKFLGFVLPRYKDRIRKHRKISYTSLSKFDFYAREIKNAFTCDLFWIGVLPANDDYEIALKGIKKKVSQYNDIIKRNIGENYIDISDIEKDKVMSDNIHLNRIGHEFVYNKVLDVLSKNNL